MSTDPFKGLTRTYEMPSNHFFDITPNDATDLTIIPRAIYVGVSGDVAVMDEQGNTITFTNAFQGTILPIRVSRVMATGTSAGSLVGLV